MPLYMDQHILPGVKARDVAEAHRLDMMVQGEHGCECMTYWVDEKRGNVFCLIEAPDKASVTAMHQKAHGLVPNKVIEVSEELVESFLGRIADPIGAVKDKEGLKVFEDSSLRVLMMVKLEDPILCRHLNGEEGIKNWNEQLGNIRKSIKASKGREVEYEGHYLLASFVSVNDATDAAVEILTLLKSKSAQVEESAIAIQAGEPVNNDSRLFGQVIDSVIKFCTLENKARIVIGEKAAELLAKENLADKKNLVKMMQPDESIFLIQLFEVIDRQFHNADFNVEDCCRTLAMSTSQFYRKTVNICGMSPNNLLKKIRLQHSKVLLQRKTQNVSQVSFDTGFTSSSYFTKCFKKQFGLLPQTYQQLASQQLNG
jgi:AraC-like DNA-binding protein